MICVYLRDLRVTAMVVWWPCDAFVSLCLRVCDVRRASVFLLSVFLLCVSVPLWFDRKVGEHGDGYGRGVDAKFARCLPTPAVVGWGVYLTQRGGIA